VKKKIFFGPKPYPRPSPPQVCGGEEEDAVQGRKNGPLHKVTGWGFRRRDADGGDRDGRARALEKERAWEGGSPSVAVLPATS
jgi:hypothetical protein